MFYFLHIIMKIINKVFVGLGVLSIFVVSFVIVNASYQEWILYSDNYRESLNEIKDNPDFKITIWTEYFFIVENKKNGEEVKVNIPSEYIDDFENYSSESLGIELNHMLPRDIVKLAYNEGKSKREVETDKKSINSENMSQYTNLSSAWNNTFKVTFNANGWIWDNEITEDAACLYKLPESKFTPEKWKEFKWWAKSANWPVISGDAITISGDTTLYAIWDNDCKDTFYSCPDGAMCSSVMCDWIKKRRVERCQDGYEMENWVCKCYTEIKQNAVLDWTYECGCPYWDMCFLQVWLSSLCSVWWGCDTVSYSNGMKMNYVYFMLDDKRGSAAWINNIETLRITRRMRDWAGNDLWLYWGDNNYYFSPSECERLWEQYFSEEWKELSIEYVSDSMRNCKSGCKCVDINDCPENDRIACLRDKELWKRFNLNSNQVCPAIWGCKETPSGWKCTTYSKNKSYECNKYEKTSTCIKWIWDRDPWEYGSCGADSLSVLNSNDSVEIMFSELGDHVEEKQSWWDYRNFCWNCKNDNVYTKTIKLGGKNPWSVELHASVEDGNYEVNDGNYPKYAHVSLEKQSNNEWLLSISVDPAYTVYGSNRHFVVTITNDKDDSEITVYVNQEIKHYAGVSLGERSFNESEGGGLTHGPFEIFAYWDCDGGWSFTGSSNVPWIHINIEDKKFSFTTDKLESKGGRTWSITFKGICKVDGTTYTRYDVSVWSTETDPSFIHVWQRMSSN